MSANGSVVVVGPPRSGVSAVAAALSSRLTDRRVVEWAGRSEHRPPFAVVFVASAAAHLTPSQAGLLDSVLAATGPVDVVGAVSKIDLHRGWADVLEANRVVLPVRWVGVAAEPDIGPPRLDDLADAVRNARDRPRRPVVARAELIARRGDLAQARLRLSGQIHGACAQLRAELHRQAGELNGRAIGVFPETTVHRVAEMIAEWDLVMAAEFAAVTAGCGVDGGGQPAEPLPAVPARCPERRSRTEARLTALIGAAFGTGTALTASRLFGDMGGAGLLPGGTSGPAAAIGLALAAWVIRTRRLLSERSSLQRWAAEVLGATRLVLEQRVTSRALTAEVSIGVSAAGRIHPPVPGRRPAGTGDTAD